MASYEMQKAAAGASRYNVQNIMPAQETASAKKIGEGLGEEYIGWQKSGLDAWGITDDTALVDAAQAISRDLALQLRNPAGGAGMPGAMSDSDRQYLTSMVAGTETTPEAIPFMLDAARRVEQRNKDVAEIARKYKAAHNGAIDDGVYDEITAYANAHPLFTDEDARRIGALGKASGGQPAPQANIPQIKDASGYDSLPPGAQYYDPDGVLRTKRQ
jgi:hypothetical protein